MGFSNPPIPWSEFERRLSGRRAAETVPSESPDAPRETHAETPEQAEGPGYAELHAHSNFSFLDGASGPDELVTEAVRLGLHGLALTDHNGFYGAVRLAEAAEKHPDLRTMFGAELTLGLDAPQNGVPDPAGQHLLLLARGIEGYHALAGAITRGQLAPEAEKGAPRYDPDVLADRLRGRVIALTGCRKGPVRSALETAGLDAARTELILLEERFGAENVLVELTDLGDPRDSTRNDALASLARERGLPIVATTAAHAAAPDRRRLARALAAVRARTSIDAHAGWLPAAGGAYLRSPAEMHARFARYPGAAAHTVTVAEEIGFRLRSARPRLPRQEVPEGHTPMSWLRELTWRGAAKLYPNMSESDRDRITRELAVIEQKDFPGYFLIVHDIVRFARSRGILCQGRGSAANSAVCYLLEITAVDSIAYGLPFERFLSSLRAEEPDIDVDFDADRREEVIQYVYERYGRFNAAQVANVITYRPKAAIRDMAKALGYTPGQQDAWSKRIERGSALAEDPEIPEPLRELSTELLGFPRHLGIHSGGMVLTDRPVGEVCPIEHGRMDGRTVLQWDKDDCAWMGLVKFDLLGLGMLAAIQHCFDLVEAHTGEHWDLHSLPKEEAGVYDQLCRADAVGVFQVESRAQLGMLPRLRPRTFYDLVIEVALVRPGPIQGGAVHPYIRRRMGQEPVTYLHPSLEPVLERTLGIPLFQEQLMQMAMAVGGCDAEDADLLRRAMGSKRGREKIATLREKLYAGMAENGIVGAEADNIYERIEAFSNFGFAESHSISFALIVYASAWLRLHYPGAFLAALLRAQPMGFYAPHTLVADATRHGVQTLRPDLHRSGVDAGLEPLATVDTRHSGMDACLHTPAESPGPFDPAGPNLDHEHRRDAGFAVRLGLAGITGIGAEAAARIVAERERGGEYTGMDDLGRRTGLSSAQLEALATSGACDGLGTSRRQALWQAGPASRESPNQLAGSAVTVQPPLFAMLDAQETLAADLWATGISTDDHPLAGLRGALSARDILGSAALRDAESGRRVRVAGVVVHRQRPATASGITFVNLEDEDGMINVICSVGLWNRYRRVLRESPALVIRGILERSPEGIINVVADGAEPLDLAVRTRSRDFQ
ncbi:DNA polymerase III subunit alpha [Mycetocola tolaasinivorans]|uniref:Error-prone DNA polymerase n=1 Tax=Mycetocola tolaasinivorans TaxID=76635 RepID=A0A3L7AAN2_9MICO|nr:error-prone DNA polymerase [Mycetocola tolaasinivorans]RLP77363.1 DNA polymerase III subunit alpha [Mycetocola tolaasinivorans]